LDREASASAATKTSMTASASPRDLDKLQHVPCVLSEDVCDTFYTILLKDLHKTAKQWTGMDGELGEISLEVERMIVKELIEEIVKDLASGFCSSCHLSTKPIEPVARRKLFAP
jgi:hypothetical protein